MEIKIFKGELQLIHKVQKLVEENGYVLIGASNNPKTECREMIFNESKQDDTDFFEEYDDKHRIVI